MWESNSVGYSFVPRIPATVFVIILRKPLNKHIINMDNWIIHNKFLLHS